ncbi:hypothetical protein LBMAG27_19940 [Bacteroidota bacterium]|nr:hypothetical protein LBMAG27_19940 [Bacteroidota bacterium]
MTKKTSSSRVTVIRTLRNKTQGSLGVTLLRLLLTSTLILFLAITAFAQSGTVITDTHNKGYWEDGKIISHWNCPDDLSYPAVNLKSWNKVPCVNGRLPTYAETQNGTSIHHYGGSSNPDVKPYNEITLPKLAYIKSPMTGLNELVIVIQMVQNNNDIIAGYRYVTGGCGGSLLQDFHFLTDDEIKKEVDN